HANAIDLRDLLRPCRERPSRCRAAKQRDELASPHGCPLLRLRATHYHTVAQERRCASQQKLRDDVADGSWLCENSSARAISLINCISESQIILHTPGSIPCWRIVFSTFRECMSFYTWGNSGIEPYSGSENQLSRNQPGPPHGALQSWRAGMEHY